MKYQCTSESVGEGHPDKICDQISDAIVDEALRQDADSRVGCECFTTTGLVLVGGEITTRGYIDVQALIRDLLARIGYSRPEAGLDYRTCSILSSIHDQSPDIARAVSSTQAGAGDQGMMFGYASTDTPVFMPAPIYFSHRLMEQAAALRHDAATVGGAAAELLPDAKCQLTIDYEDDVPVRAATVIMSQHHTDALRGHQGELSELLTARVIRPVLGSLLDERTEIVVNPAGPFVVGGPAADTGLTGRKVVVDTYGASARHGGGAISGKDPSKVDRSASYAARYIAKHIVAAGLASECEVELAYAIGRQEPVSVSLRTRAATIDTAALEQAIRRVFPLTPREITETLGLARPIYGPTARFGHFGREEFPWEQLDRIDDLKRVL